MAINVKGSQCETREARLGSITTYSGTLQDIGAQSVCSGCLDEKKRCFSQSSMCNSMCALNQAARINDVAIVHHGPVGCAATAMDVPNTWGLLADTLGKKRDNFGWTCTDMTESDTVFGAVDNLKEVIIETYNRYKPKAIFIGASCVSGVIGEDLEGVLDDLKEQVPVPIAPIHCEGFKSQIWASGFDATFHAILRYIVKPPKKKTNKVNVINFAGGTTWDSRGEVKRLFNALGVEPTFFLASSSVEELEEMSEAVATISTCSTLSSYIGNGLEKEYGVPYIRSLQPHGIVGYEDWARKLAKVLGKEKEAEIFIAQEKEKYQAKIDEVVAKLQGKRAMIAMGPGFGVNYSRILQSFGMKVEHLSVWHFDKQYDDGQLPPALAYQLEYSENDFSFSVNDLQNFEYINILNRLVPDILISRHGGTTVWSHKIGIPALNVFDEYTSFGYQGTLRFAQSVLYAITNKSFTENLAKRVKLPYKEWSLKQPFDAFIK
ncbi:MAG: nitrogenase component 1 [Paludibacteraceae bacterium]|nr:nitrogenase component 1 [Paludibacteraceae bacterium]